MRYGSTGPAEPLLAQEAGLGAAVYADIFPSYQDRRDGKHFKGMVRYLMPMKMNPETRAKVMEKIKSRIESVVGVLGAAELNEQQRKTMEGLENEAMKNVLGGMGRGRNDGLKEALSKEVVIALFVDLLFDIPQDSTVMQLVCRGEVVGKASMDPKVIEEHKKDRNYIILSDFFIIRRDAKLSAEAFASGESCFVFNGAKVADFERIPEIRDHIVAIPSPPGFNFIHEIFKDDMNLSDPQIGGFLLGFNLCP
jgi:hypothetical protein